MTLHLLRISFETLGNVSEPPPQPRVGAWQLYAPYEPDQDEPRVLVRQVEELKSRPDQKAAFNALRKLIKVAATGSPLTVHYDEKQCHEIHQFLYQDKVRKIWRIRNGDIRLIFYYGRDRLIFLPGVIAKRKDKLTKGEQDLLERAVRSYIDAEATQQLILLERCMESGV